MTSLMPPTTSLMTSSVQPAPTTLDTSLPQLTFVSVSQVTVAAFPQRDDPVQVSLQDGTQRSFTGTLTFDFANGVAEGGLDEGAEAADTWYYLYLVPSAADDDVLVLRASNNPPSTGPTGFSNFEYIGAFFNDSGSDILRFLHVVGSEFFYAQPTIILSQSNMVPDNDVWATQDLSNHIPETAAQCYIQGRITTAGSQTVQLFLSGLTGVFAYHAQAHRSNTAVDNADISAWKIPIFTAQTIFRNVRVENGVGNVDSVQIHCLGYIDSSLRSS